MRSALLIRLGGLGDLLAAAPSIQFIRRKFPAAHLTMICRKEYGALLRELGIVNSVLRVEGPRLAPLFLSPCPPDCEAADWVRRFDVIVAWKQGQEADDLERNLLTLAGAEKCMFFHYRPGRPEPVSRHFYEHTAAALAPGPRLQAGLTLDSCARLPAGKTQHAKALKLTDAPKTGKRFVVVHPGSGGKAKVWPLGRFLDIIGRLGRKGVNGALVTGEAETDMDKILQKEVWPAGWTWLRSPSLEALCGLFNLASLYIGNDSGITHLAAACGSDVIALFLEKNAAAWRPLGRVHLLSASSVALISVETVWRTVEGRLRLSS